MKQIIKPCCRRLDNALQYNTISLTKNFKIRLNVPIIIRNQDFNREVFAEGWEGASCIYCKQPIELMEERCGEN